MRLEPRNRNAALFLGVAAAMLTLLSACGSQGDPTREEPLVRLAPVDIEVSGGLGDPTRLIDGDMVSPVRLSGSVRVRYFFDSAVRPEELRVHGAEGLRVRVRGLGEKGGENRQSFDLDDRGWARRRIDSGETWLVDMYLEPVGEEASLTQLALWGRHEPEAGAGEPSRWIAEGLWGRGRQAWLGEAEAYGILLDAHDRCGEAVFQVPMAVSAQARRVFLSYRGPGLHRPVVLQRSIGGRPASGGLWLGGGEREQIVLDELDPAMLEGRTSVVLCLPDEVVQAVPVRDLWLVVLLDDGRMPLDHQAEEKLAGALDGQESSAAALAAGAHRFGFERPMQLDRGAVSVLGADVRAGSVSVRAIGGWQEVMRDVSWPVGTSELVLSSGPAEGALGIGVDLGHGGREGLPAANLSRLEIYGDALGSREGMPRIVVTYPRAGADGRLEHFGSKAYVAGYVAGIGVGSDTEVRVDGRLRAGAPQIASMLERPEGEVGPWTVTISARLADGTLLERILVLDDDRSEDVRSGLDGERLAAGDAAFGAVDEMRIGTITPEEGGEVVLGSRVRLVAPPGAVTSDTQVAIQRKAEVAVPPLDPGLINVTAPDGGAYRFLPPGQRFERAVRVHLPYAPHLLPSGTPPEEVQTYYHDEAEDRWRPLARAEVDRATGTVVSETTHFTFMINAVLELPDHPGVTSFDPNRIRNLEAADPSAGIDLIEPPEGNNHGTARLGLPIRLPPARGAYQPGLSLAYDSDGGNGWLGVGWDLPVSSVQIDTRHGVPHYDGTERFVLDGAQLVPSGMAAASGTCGSGVSGKLYRARVEGAFQRIVHCGADAMNRGGWWKVRSKDGTLFVYGRDPSARLADPSNGIRVGQWMLERVVDTNGNLTEYEYEEDTLAVAAGEAGSKVGRNHGESFTRLYLHMIRYTGHIDAGSPFSEPGFRNRGRYEVLLRHEAVEREDVIVSARTGFKVVTRRLLREIDVVFTPDQLVRRYRLSYEEGDFSRSLLSRVEVFGAGPAGGEPPLFHVHELDYYRAMPATDTSESVPAANVFCSRASCPSSDIEILSMEHDGVDEDGLSQNESTTWTGSAWVGLSIAPQRSLGGAGIRVGGSTSRSTTNSLLVDITGNALPDRVMPGRVLLSQRGSRMVGLDVVSGELKLRAKGPLGDADENRQVELELLDIGADRGRSIQGGTEVFLPALSFNLGLSHSQGRSPSFLMDVDGDGLVDLVTENGIFLQAPREGACGPWDTECCDPGRICFNESVPGPARPGSLLDDDEELRRAREQAESELHLTDAVLQWTAPYDGTVRFDLSLERRFPDPETEDLEALVEVLHMVHTGPKGESDKEPLFEVKLEAGDAPVALSVPALVLARNDRIVVRVSTVGDMHVDADVTPPLPLDEILVGPRVRYETVCVAGTCESVSADARELRDPMGGSLYDFVATDDLRLAGEPMPALHMELDGTLEIRGTVERHAYSPDDARICIQHFPNAEELVSRPCESDDLLFAVVAWDELGTALVPTRSLEVNYGEYLVFRIESDLPVDPGDVTWSPRVSLTEQDGTVHETLPDVHWDAQTTLDDQGRPLVPLVIPTIDDLIQDHPDLEGVTVLSVETEGVLEVKLTPRFGTLAWHPLHLAVLRERELVHKETVQRPFPPALTHEEAVHGGESFTFVGRTRISRPPRPFDEWFEDDSTSFTVSAKVHLSVEVEEDIAVIIHGRPQIITVQYTRVVTVELDPDGYMFFDRQAPVPYSGGWRGWRVAEWNGNFDYEEGPHVGASGIDTEGYGSRDDEENAEHIAERMRDEDSVEARASKAWAPMVPRRDAGLLAGGRPGWIGPDGNAFVAIHHGASGDRRVSLHGARRTGGRPDDRDRFAIGAPTTDLAPTDALRMSTETSLSLGFGLGFGSFGLSTNLSWGQSDQKVDLRDMDGDGVADLIAGDQVTFTDRRTVSAGDRTVVLPEKSARRTYRFTVTAGTDVSPCELKQGSDRGRIFCPALSKANVGISGGVSFSNSTNIVAYDLIDINGDGLADAVRYQGGKLLVRLNLGGRFADSEDVYPVNAWPQIGLGDLVDKVRQSLTNANDEAEGDEERKGMLAELDRQLARLNTANVLERSTSTSVSMSAGASVRVGAYGELGGSIGVQASASRTQVALRDVTGNGLPDLVREAPDGGLIVQVNLGDRYADPVHWRAPQWPDTVRLLLPFGDSVREKIGLNDGQIEALLDGTAPTPSLKPLADLLGFLELTRAGLNSVEYTASHSVAPGQVGAFGTAYIPLTPFQTPYLYIGAGGSRSTETSGVQLRLMDMSGDGFADHVLKTQGVDDAVYVRRNVLGTLPSNVLQKVRRPLGGSIALGYSQIGGTQDLPRRRWVMTDVTVADGYGTGTGHTFLTRYGYEDPRWDRAEREMLGFARVLRQNPDGSLLDRRYHNETYAMRGLLASETLQDAGGNNFVEIINRYDVGLAGVAPAQCDQKLPRRMRSSAEQCSPVLIGAIIDEIDRGRCACESRFPMLTTIEQRHYEGQEAPKITTTQSFTYGDFGNVISFEHEMPGRAEESIRASIEYTSTTGGSGLRDRHIVGLPTSVEVFDGTGRLLRDRSAIYDPTTGNLSTFTTKLGTGIGPGETATTTLKWTRRGNLRSVTGPPNASAQRYTVSYDYDKEVHTYVTEAEDSHDLISLAEYDYRFGVPLRFVDSNDNEKRRELDEYGRLVKIWGPYDIGSAEPTIEMKYFPGGSGSGGLPVIPPLPFSGPSPSGLPSAPDLPYALTHHKRPADEESTSGLMGTLDTLVYIDGLGRVRQTQKHAQVLRGEQTTLGWTVSGQLRFDAMGRVAQQGQVRFRAGMGAGYVDAEPKNPTLFSYDVLGRTTRTVLPDGAITRVTYGFGTPAGDAHARFKASVTDARGNLRVVYRDPEERIVAVEERLTAGDGWDAATLTTRYEYTATGELREITDAGNNTTSMTYDLLGRRLSLDNPDAGLTEYRYDPTGNLIMRLDANMRERGGSLAGAGRSPVVRYEYDFNRLTAIRYPNTDDVEYTYGEPGAAHNAAGRIVRVRTGASASAPSVDEKREYGRLGEVTAIDRTIKSLRPGDHRRHYRSEYAFDSFGRMQHVVYPDGEVVRYRYDFGGLVRSAVGTHDGRREVYLARLDYDEFGQRVRAQLGNGVTTSYAYEEKTRRLSSLSTTQADGLVLQDYTYSYDLVGNVTGITHVGGSHRLVPQEMNQSFSYDSLYRLTQASGSLSMWGGTKDEHLSRFRYDGIHNMTRKVQEHVRRPQMGEAVRHQRTNHDFGYEYGDGAPHQAIRIGDTELTYDANGNTLTEIGGHGQGRKRRQYDWDDENRLNWVMDGGRVTSFLYDAAGDRVVKRGRYGETIYVNQFYTVRPNARGTKHVFVGESRLASKVDVPAPDRAQQPVDPDDPVVLVSPREPGRSADAPGIPIACVSGASVGVGLQDRCVAYVDAGTNGRRAGRGVKNTFYYHTDHLGSTSYMSDLTGEVYEHVAYFPYGEVWREDGRRSREPLIGESYGYTGKPHDPETGLIYFGARYYNPGFARWASFDPALIRAEAPSPRLMSSYAQSYNNPIGYVDPNGEAAWLALIPLFVFIASMENDQDINVPPAIAAMAFPMAGAAMTLAQLASAPARLQEIDAEMTSIRAGEHGSIILRSNYERLEELQAEKRAIYTDVALTAAAAGLGAAARAVPGRGSSGATRAHGLLGPGTRIGPKISGQMASRGWNREAIDRVIANPTRTRAVRDRRHLPGGARVDDPATAYLDRHGHYVIRNDRTGDIVQVSNRHDLNWAAPWD